MPRKPVLPVKLTDKHLSAQPWDEMIRSGELKTLPEAAAILGVSRSSVYRYCEAGQIPCFFKGRRLVIRPEALREFADRYYYNLQN